MISILTCVLTSCWNGASFDLRITFILHSNVAVVLALRCLLHWMIVFSFFQYITLNNVLRNTCDMNECMRLCLQELLQVFLANVVEALLRQVFQQWRSC